MKKSDVEEYLSLHAAAAIAKKRMAELKEILLPQLREGAPSPPELPYLLELRISNRTTKDYETPLMKRLIRDYGKPEAEKRMAAIEANFEVKEIEQLTVVQNKALAAQPALEQLRTA